MSGSLTNEFESRLLNLLFGASSYSPPAQLEIALSTQDPGEDGSALLEPVGNNYGRVLVANNGTTWTASSNGSPVSNAIVITFPTPSGSWGTISHVAVLDPTQSPYRVVAKEALNQSKAISASSAPVKFLVGALTISAD